MKVLEMLVQKPELRMKFYREQVWNYEDEPGEICIGCWAAGRVSSNSIGGMLVEFPAGKIPTRVSKSMQQRIYDAVLGECRNCFEEWARSMLKQGMVCYNCGAWIGEWSIERLGKVGFAMHHEDRLTTICKECTTEIFKTMLEKMRTRKTSPVQEQGIPDGGWLDKMIYEPTICE